MAEVMIDPHEMVARVSPRVHPKYARKLVQDRLKAETPYSGGWFVSIQNLYDEDADYWDMKLFNDTKAAVETALVADHLGKPKHWDATHFTATTIGGRVFLYCPVGNICSWSAGDVEHKYCAWCEKFFSELL